MAHIVRPMVELEPGDLATRFGSTSNQSRDRIEVGTTNQIVRTEVQGEALLADISYRYVSSR